jgi:hypothetical protein
MKANTYRGGIKPYEEIKKFRNTKSDPLHRQSSPDSVFLLPEASPLIVPQPTKQKSASQRFEPTSDEISIEKSIDEIFLDVGKQNLSSYDEIEMIRERLLQLKTIQFYGVLEIPYLLSPSSGDEDKATSIGGAPKKQRAQEPEKVQVIPEIEAKVQAKEDLLKSITQSTSIGEITKLNTEFVKISREILTFIKNSALESDKKTIDFSKLKKEDKEALITLGMMITKVDQDIKDINTREKQFMGTILDEIVKINESKEAYNKGLNSIFFKYENSSEMKRHDREVSTLISQIKKLKAEITAPTRIQLERDPKYIGFETTFAQLQTVITTAKRNIDATEQGAPSTTKTDSLWAKNLQPANPFTITNEECNKIIRAFRGQLILTREYGKAIFDVWENSLRYIIDLQKSLFLKGYTTDEEPLTNIEKYHNIMSKVDHKSLILEFKNAFIAQQGGYYIKFRYKPGQSPVSDPCHIFFFYRFREKDKELPEEKFGDFHLTIHLGGQATPDTAASSQGRMGNLDFREGKIHLVSDQNDYENKANLLPYIFTKTNDALPGENECMQLIPVYQPNAHHNHKVINTGRVITKVLNDYLQTLHIDLGGTSGKQDKELIDKISSYLLKQPNTNMQKDLLHQIMNFENKIREITNKLVRDMMKGFYLSKTVEKQKALQIDKLLTSLTSINNFIQQQKTYAQEISISKNNPTFYENIIKTMKLRLDELKIKAQAALAHAETVEAALAKAEARRNSFTRVLGERTHNSDATQTETAARATREATAREAPAVEQRVTRSKTRKAAEAAEAAQSSETEIPYSESIEFEPRETTEIPVASGRKKRKIKYTKKKYNKVSRKRYNNVSNKRYNKVSSKRYNKVSSKRYNKVSRKNGNYNKQ